MKRLIKQGLMVLTICGLSFIECEAMDWGCEDIEGSLETSAGYRQDFLQWSIQGLDNNPNILSELTFEDIRIFQVRLEGDLLFRERIYARANFNYGWILDGKVQDSDYLGNNRTSEFSKSLSQCNDDDVWDVSGGLGYVFDIYGACVIPLVGYSQHEQNLRITDGEQVIDTLGIIGLGEISGLNSTYKARWYGPWIGVDVNYPLTCDLTLYTSYEHHWARYEGRGHWNLREDFLGDFVQKANMSHGEFFSVGLNYMFCENWNIGLTGNYQFWKSNHGSENATVVDEGGGIFPAFTNVNPVKWRSFAFLVDAGYCF